MSNYNNSIDGPVSRLDGALARIDNVIDNVSKKLDESRQERRNLAEERDRALAELAALRDKHEQLQAKADHAAERIEVLISIVERNFPELLGTVAISTTQTTPAAQEAGNTGDNSPGYANPQPAPVNYGY